MICSLSLMLVKGLKLDYQGLTCIDSPTFPLVMYRSILSSDAVLPNLLQPCNSERQLTQNSDASYLCSADDTAQSFSQACPF